MILPKGRRMASYKVKHRIGEEIEAYGVPGIITAVTIREGNRVYEVGYLDKDDKPSYFLAQECELQKSGSKSMGFRKE